MNEIQEKLGVQTIDEQQNELNTGVLNRKLKSIGDESDEFIPVCPERSPKLLGPLYVKQTGIPDLKRKRNRFFDILVTL